MDYQIIIDLELIAKIKDKKAKDEENQLKIAEELIKKKKAEQKSKEDKLKWTEIKLAQRPNF